MVIAVHQNQSLNKASQRDAFCAPASRRYWGISLIQKLFFLISCYLITSCGYEGNGRYEAQGIWPFTTYSLELPAFDFVSEKEAHFKLRGYGSHGTSFIKINLLSETPLYFPALDTTLEMRVVGGITTYFYRKSPLNAHFERMVSLGESVWVNEYEWHGRYLYSNAALSNKVVPFSASNNPEVTETFTYTHSLPTGTEDLDVFVKIGRVPDDFKDIKFQLVFQSGWK